MKTYLNTPADMKWLNDVHLKLAEFPYKAAVLHGNEDCPQMIDVFGSQNPEMTDKVVRFVLCPDNSYKQLPVKTP